MTGYGKSETQFGGAPCTIEIRTVNSRFLEFALHLPASLSQMEFPIKEAIKSRLSRGSVSLTITLGEGEATTIPTGFSEKAVEAYLKITNGLKSKYKLAGEVSLQELINEPGVLQYGNAASIEELEAHVMKELGKALDGLIKMREKEGKNLAQDLATRVHAMDEILDKIKVLDPQRITDWRDKFEARLKELLGETKLDPTRILQEASIVADKLDINEEITRFISHNKLFLEALESGTTQGKRLNFILQEMGREANTLGTKCQSAEIARYAIELKDNVETIREQVMNIE